MIPMTKETCLKKPSFARKTQVSVTKMLHAGSSRKCPSSNSSGSHTRFLAQRCSIYGLFTYYTLAGEARPDSRGNGWVKYSHPMGASGSPQPGGCFFSFLGGGQ